MGCRRGARGGGILRLNARHVAHPTATATWHGGGILASMLATLFRKSLKRSFSGPSGPGPAAMIPYTSRPVGMGLNASMIDLEFLRYATVCVWGGVRDCVCWGGSDDGDERARSYGVTVRTCTEQGCGRAWRPS